MSSPPRLLFVYNADAGLLNGLKDIWHKVVSPETYPCSLCGVTYGPLGMKREWKEFVRGLGREVKFLHRDELRAQYGVQGVALPAVFEVQGQGKPALWLPAEEIDRARSLDDLIALVRRAQQAGRPERAA
ncbi:hypothetical protein [Deinococcus koreensis]|uniref:GTPase n=1 Tax=Deinococcus koreensis TaxID=2054903 RepID=A0A2K3V0G6_9DEIO|nr:hypothetical protein [Deinococcus koreensis]PNY82262.1 hypothetical protein CVO96_13640 [Deinococcus koreensis]